MRYIYAIGGKMKKILSILFATAITCQVFAIDIFKYAPVAGNVKSYTETDYTIASKFGSYTRTPKVKTIHLINNFGREVESIEATPRDKIIDKISSTYNASGILIGQICTNADDEIIWTSEITYKDGLKSDSSEYDANHNLKVKVIYTYTDSLLTDESGYNGDGALIWKIIYKYNEDGKLEVESLYNSDGTLNERKTYTYTDAGKTDTITTLDEFSKKVIQQVFRYAPNGFLNEITYYNGQNDLTSRVVFKYDGEGNVNRMSEYVIVNKFETTINELVFTKEVSYQH